MKTCFNCANIAKCHIKEQRACKTYIVGPGGRPVLVELAEWRAK